MNCSEPLAGPELNKLNIIISLTADAPKSSMSVIIGVVVGVLVIVVICVVVIVIVIRKKRRPKRATKYRGSPGARSSWESSSLKSLSLIHI